MSKKPIDPAAIRDFVTTVRGLSSKSSNDKRYLTGTVTHTDPDGTVWVSVAGGVGAMPVTRSTASYSPGDLVSFSIEDGVASMGGNVTDPAAGGDRVIKVTKHVDLVENQLTVTQNIVAGKAEIADLNAATATIQELQAADVTITGQLTAVNGEITNLKAKDVTIEGNLSAATGRIDTLESDNVTVNGRLDAAEADIDDLEAEDARITNLVATKANISDLEANYITADDIEATYMHANMSNSDVAWISNGVIANGAISSAMINDVSANKLTAGTINGSVINVTNLNADNITAGTINGQRIGEGSLSLDKLSEDVYTEAEVDAKLSTMQQQIDGAIETWTGTAVPTLQNSPASSWTTVELKDQHVGDVYFVVNSQSQQNGYNYRFTKSGSTYSWQLIKDSDVTNALQRISAAEGSITQFDSDISQLQTDTGSLATRATSLEGRMDDAEDDIALKVDTMTFNSLSDTVDGHTQTISQHTTAIASKADGSTVTTLSNKVDTIEDTVDGHTQTIGSLQTTVASKADGSTVTTISNKVNSIETTVNGHTETLSSTTATLKTAIKSTVQLWFSKADTTAPSKPTAHVTSTATTGNAWTTVVPAYDSSYPNYFYCYEWQYTDGTYGWSAVTRDIAMGETQATSRTAASDASSAVSTANTASSNASTALSTANTASSNASTALTTANSAKSTADGAASDASTALSTANTASSDASTAVSTANTAKSTADTAKSTADKNVKTSVQLWFTKANTTKPNAPTSKVTSTATTGNAWTTVVPAYNSSYPYYYYCWQYVASDGTVTWSDVVYDQATSESEQQGRKGVSDAAAAASAASTADGKAVAAQTTANSNIKSSVQLWFTKADDTAPGKPTAQVTTDNASTANAWNLAVPTYNAAYPNYFYCYQYQKGDGTYTWSDVVLDRATTENQAVARAASSGLSTLQTDYATFKQTTQQFESTVGTTYATKQELQDGLDDKADSSGLSSLESRVSTAETTISNNSSAIALKANASDVYTKAQSDGLISTEVTNRNAAIEAKASEISLSVSQNYTTKTEFNALDFDSTNLMKNARQMPLGASDASIGRWRLAGSANMQKSRVEIDDGPYGPCGAFQLVGTQSTTTDTSCFGIDNFPFPKNYEIYEMSFYARVTNGEGKAGILCNSYSKSRTDAGNTTEMWGDYNVADLTTEWKRIWVRFKVLNERNNLYIGGAGTNATIQICMVRLGQASATQTSLESAKAEIKVTTDGISSEVSKKVGNDEVISRINQSAESVTIDATRVNIEGAAIFTSGRLSQSSLDGAYDASGAASAAQAAAEETAAADATSKANAARDAAISAAATDATAKANAANAMEQLIYKSAASGTTSMSATTTWVTDATGAQATWTVKRPTYSPDYPVLFVATQRQTVGGTVTCTTPMKDDTTTVIDGGSIVTGTIDASKATITNINGANITAGTLSIGQVSNLQDTLTEMESDLTNEISEQSAAAFTVADNIQGQVTTILDGLLTSTYFVQDGDSYTFNLLETTIDGLTGDLEEISSYVRIETEDGSPVLKLGSNEAPVYAALSNSALEFRTQAGDVIAYFLVEDGVGKLKIDNAVILQELQFGDWKWTPRANGNLSLKWIGA